MDAKLGIGGGDSPTDVADFACFRLGLSRRGWFF